MENERKNFYKKKSIELNLREEKKVVNTSDNVNTCKYEDQLIFLMDNIPYWETYLTEKQAQACKLFYSCKNTVQVSRQMYKDDGYAWGILFGRDINSGQGAYGRLKKTWSIICKNSKDKNMDEIGKILNTNTELFVKKQKIANCNDYSKLMNKSLSDHEKLLLEKLEKNCDWREMIGNDEEKISIVENYIKFKNSTIVDTELELRRGKTWEILFGKSGLLNKLENRN